MEDARASHAGWEMELVPHEDGAVAILPPEIIDRLGVDVGDKVCLTEREDGFSLHRHPSSTAEQRGVAREVMARRRNALSDLADR